MSSTVKKKDCSIKIYARQRPMSPAELAQKSENIVHNVAPREIQLKSGCTERKYYFDNVFNDRATQLDVYNVIISPMLSNVLEGHNCTVLAYGQTGSGKTYTILGELKPAVEPDYKGDNTVGLVPRSAYHLFTELNKLPLKMEHSVRISLIEIYNEEVRDLFNQGTPLRIYENPLSKGSICIKDMSKVSVVGTSEVYTWLRTSVTERQNAVLSSRSHLLFTFTVSIREVTSKGEEIIRTGHLQLVDLAGSENTGKSAATNVRAREAGTMNRSLITLTKVIRALSQKRPHIPYRDSKLTRILQESLGGNSRTAMIATFSPSATHWDETINTLELTYAARSIVNSPQVNVSKKQANLLKELEDEVTKLKDELSAVRRGEGFYVSAETYKSMNADIESANKNIMDSLKCVSQLEHEDRELDMQSRSLSDSFKKTTDFLEGVVLALKMKKEENEAQLKKLQRNMEENKKLARDTAILRDVCDKSTKNEEIYHGKFQNKCTTNLNNIEQTREMVGTFPQCLQDLAAGCREHMKHISERLETLRASTMSLRHKHLEDLNRIDELFRDINNHAKGCLSQMEELAPGFSRTDTCEFIENIFAGRRRRNGNQQKIPDSLGKLKSVADTELTEQQKQSQEVLSMIRDTVSVKEESVALGDAHLQSLRTTLEEREYQFPPKLKMEEANMSFLSNIVIEYDREDEAAAAAITKMESETSLVRDFTDNSVYFKPIEKVEKTVSDFMENCGAALQTQQVMIDQVMADASDQEISMCNEVKAEIENSTEYARNLTQTVNERLSMNNAEFHKTCQEWEETFDEISESPLKMAINKIADMEKILVQVSVSEKRSNKDIKEIVKATLAANKLSNEKIVALGHIGDTPAKQSYVLPKRFARSPSATKSSLGPVSFEDDESDKENVECCKSAVLAASPHLNRVRKGPKEM